MHKVRNITLLPVFLFYAVIPAFADSTNVTRADSNHVNYKRLVWVAGGSAVAYTATLIGLNELWYKDYPRSSFHFFNDNQEWLQMDKFGHAFTAYYVGVGGIELMKWTGLPRKKAIWVGGAYGFVFLTTIEILDGFSAEWGASMGDIAANSAGSALCIGQALLWDEQRIWMKFSWTRSQYADLRPNVLGSNFPEQLIKDYNAQTYWLSVNPSSFMKKDTRFPRWLNIAVGYGADGMLGGYGNIWVDSKTGQEYDYSHIPRYRQFYLSPDIDLTRIKTKSRFLKVAFIALNCLKFPMPALEYNTQNQFKWHWMKF